MDKPRVFLRDQKDYDEKEIASTALEIFKASGVDPGGKTVLVKPSFVYPSRSEIVRGIITQPRFAVGVCMALRELGARRVLMCESSVIGPSRVSFYSVGIMGMLKGLAEPVFLDERETVEVEVKDPFIQARFPVPRLWLDADLYVSLPKIKTNMFAEVTLSVKNNLGMLRQRDRLLHHNHNLHKKLADLYKVRPPDLVISDCVVAGEGQGPLMADPVDLGLILGGTNAVAVDRVACHLTGYEPHEVEHLKLLIEAGYGPGEMEGIDIDGAELLGRARPFKRPVVSLKDLSPRLRVFEGAEFCCPWGCAGLVQGAVDAYVDRYGADNLQPMNLIVGKPIGHVPDDLDPEITIVLGDCAEPYKNRGTFVPGCMPRPLDVGLVLQRLLGPVEVDMALTDVMRGYAGHNLWRAGKIISGHKIAPTENHVNFPRVVKEFMIMRKLRKKARAQK